MYPPWQAAGLRRSRAGIAGGCTSKEHSTQAIVHKQFSATWRRSQMDKAADCKSAIYRFDSDRRLFPAAG